jgi:hypothetical protein
VAAPTAPTRDALAIAPEEWKRRLVQLFAGDTGPAVKMIEATGRELAAYPIYDLPTVSAMARRVDRAGRRRRACDLSERRPGGFAGDRGCRRPGEMPPRRAGRRGGVHRLRAIAALALRMFANAEAQAWLCRYHIDWDEPVPALSPRR